MHKYTGVIVLSCIMCSLGLGKTIQVDVTNDGVADIVKMGLKIVTVQDGVSSKLHTIVAGLESLADISVDDYFSRTKGNEIAILMLPEESFLTEVYGYRNNRFVKVSEILPGELSFDEERRLFGYAMHAWDRNEVMTYWPIIEDEGYMKAAPIVQSAETTFVVAARRTKELPFVLQDGTLTMCVAATLDTNVIVFLTDEDGTLIKQTTIDPRTGFYGRVIAEQAKTITFAVDNSQSADPKTIQVIIKQYAYR
ncbi:hypothetical protein AMJ83_10310 [candidate division WOR_3 bacterium SM23_42]|uniref:Uncharacterized protein n=1 Tax=candidate division WOR_3 bacterium SM23_42 TaxID=1703779 RepID=A0A0S8FRA7_UNCW3|nr:MAG: hypothetical protein AMJ83_10310 [candidate division WOR_3 bacterium SM23_42]